MDLLARIFDWLREQEAGFSALAAILVIASATAIRPEAGPLTSASGVRSPIAMASPRVLS